MSADVVTCICNTNLQSHRDALSLLGHCNSSYIHQGESWQRYWDLSVWGGIAWVDNFADGTGEGSFKQAK